LIALFHLNDVYNIDCLVVNLNKIEAIVAYTKILLIGHP
jgi:hypothetical protein